MQAVASARSFGRSTIARATSAAGADRIDRHGL
jgi:hypothetical protein